MNRADLHAFIQQSDEVLTALYPGTVQIGDLDPVEVAIQRGGRSQSLEIGFLNDVQTLIFRLSHADAEATPKNGQVVICEGVRYIITEVRNPLYESSYHVTCARETDLS